MLANVNFLISFFVENMHESTIIWYDMWFLQLINVDIIGVNQIKLILKLITPFRVHFHQKKFT